MKKGTGVLIVLVAALIVLAVAIFEIIGRRQGVSPISTVFRSLAPSEEKPAGDSTPAAQTPTPPRGAGPNRGARPPESGRTGRDLGRVAVPEPVPVVPVPSEPRPAAARPAPPVNRMSVGVGTRRIDTFVAGNRPGWSAFDIFVDRPMIIRAGGVLRAGGQVSGPGGAPAPIDETATQSVRVIPGAPYLALIARVCSVEMCTPPFVAGTRTLLCPSRLGLTGDLQFWTNNYVQIGGYQTVASFAKAAGGYRFQADPAPASACDGSGTGADVRIDSSASWRDGEVMRSPTFAVSSRQNSWKPFFLPMDRPFTISASGEMQPMERTKSTGPNGIAVPNEPSWTYPGTRSVTVDEQHSLLVSSMPYQALIGRLCSATSCGEPFLVGTERTICPDSRWSDRLELWINHVVTRGDNLQVPFADLEFQGRRGEYRFEVIAAPASACGR